MNNGGKILIAFAAGAVVGAVLGILFAPDKGFETRKKISEQGKKMTDAIKEKFRSGKEKFDNLKENIGQTVMESVDEYV